MLNKRSIKILTVALIAIMILMMLGSTVMAATTATIPKPTEVTIDDNISNLVSKVLGIVKWGGLIAAVVMAMYIGIKYITSSPEGKADVKKTIMYYVAGIAILLSATGIVTAIQTAIGG